MRITRSARIFKIGMLITHNQSFTGMQAPPRRVVSYSIMKDIGPDSHIFRFDNGGIHSVLVNGTWIRVISVSVTAYPNTQVFLNKNDPRLQADLVNAKRFITFMDVRRPFANVNYPRQQGLVNILDVQHVHYIRFQYDYVRRKAPMELRLARVQG